MPGRKEQKVLKKTHCNIALNDSPKTRFPIVKWPEMVLSYLCMVFQPIPSALGKNWVHYMQRCLAKTRLIMKKYSSVSLRKGALEYF